MLLVVVVTLTLLPGWVFSVPSVVVAVVSVVSCSGHPDSHARAGVPSVVVMLFSNILTYPSLSLSLYFLSS